MRELDLFSQHLARERERHLGNLLRIAAGSKSPSDYQAMVAEANAAALLGRLMGDLKELDRDSGAFVVKHLQ